MTEESHVRQSDMVIHAVAAKVSHLEAVAEAHGQSIKAVGDDFRRAKDQIFEKLETTRASVDAKTRQPMLQFVTLLVVAGGFLLTIMSLVTSHQGRILESMQRQQSEHHDGHPGWVTKLMAEKFGNLTAVIESVDAVHNKADDEHENDVAELRLRDAQFETRNDGQDSRLQRLETIAEERTARFKRVVEGVNERMDMMSGDRYTGVMARARNAWVDKSLDRLEMIHAQGEQ